MDPKLRNIISWSIKQINEQKKPTLGPKQWVAVVWAHIASKVVVGDSCGRGSKI